MSDPNLIFLALDMAFLLACGVCAPLARPAVALFMTAGLAGLGALLCLPALLFGLPATALELPAGPPGLHLHLALGPLAAFFLLMTFLSGTAVAAFQAIAGGGPRRTVPLCLAGTTLLLLAADGVTLAAGSALVCAGIVRDWGTTRTRATLLIPLLLLGAVFLLTPSGFAPRFDAIRAAPADDTRASAAALMTLAAVAGMICLRPPKRDWARMALLAGVVQPSCLYGLIRLTADLSAQAVQSWWGVALLGVGGWIAVVQAWRAAAEADIDTAVAALGRRQAGLMVTGAGLALIARAADLPQAQSLALEATMLLAVGASLAGTVITLAAEAIGAGAGTTRLSRLGSLIHTMPWTSAALAAGLLTLTALPPGLGFASVWLLLQALLAEPRTGALIDQLPLALTAVTIAVSAAAATSASVRIIGIAVLGRPRTPRGAGARDAARAGLVVLGALACLALVAGILPGPALLAFAGAAVGAVIGTSQGVRGGLMMLSTSAALPGYAALPVMALLAFASGCVILVLRWLQREAKPIGLWFGGTKPPVALPFGEPMAQSAGAGFLPVLRPGAVMEAGISRAGFVEGVDGQPEAGQDTVGASHAMPAWGGMRLPAFTSRQRLPAITSRLMVSPSALAALALWVVLGAFGILLLVLALTGGGA